MKEFLQSADRVLAVFSNEYFKSGYASLELNSAIADDPLGERRLVVPIRVEACELPRILKDLVYIDFVGKSQEEQRRALIAGIKAAMVGSASAHREVKEKPDWPGRIRPPQQSAAAPPISKQADQPVRIQFFGCDVGRGLDLKGQFDAIKRVIDGSRFAKQLELRPEFDVTDENLFKKLNAYRPNVVHISGNQNGGDVLMPSAGGGEVVVPDEALAGLLSSLGNEMRLAIIDTCWSSHCAQRVSEAIGYAIGVEGEIYDDDATRFYEIFYDAIGAGRSVSDACGQARAALQFKNKKVKVKAIPELFIKPGQDASQLFLAEVRANG